MKILVISDAHGNIDALKSLFSSGLSYDYVIYLGDSVDYGPYPDETIDFLRMHADTILMGNHDYAVAYNTDCRCGTENHEISVYTREHISMKLLGKEKISYLGSLKPGAKLDLDGEIFECFHGSPSDPLYRYLTEKNIGEADLKVMTDFGTDDLAATTVFAGHTHVKMDFRYKGRRFINPGSVGGLCRDEAGTASAALYDTANGILSFIKVKYDKEVVKKRLKELIGEKKELIQLLSMYGMQ